MRKQKKNTATKAKAAQAAAAAAHLKYLSWHGGEGAIARAALPQRGSCWPETDTWALAERPSAGSALTHSILRALGATHTLVSAHFYHSLTTAIRCFMRHLGLDHLSVFFFRHCTRRVILGNILQPYQTRTRHFLLHPLQFIRRQCALSARKGSLSVPEERKQASQGTKHCWLLHFTATASPSSLDVHTCTKLGGVLLTSQWDATTWLHIPTPAHPSLNKRHSSIISNLAIYIHVPGAAVSLMLRFVVNKNLFHTKWLN